MNKNSLYIIILGLVGFITFLILMIDKCAGAL